MDKHYVSNILNEIGMLLEIKGENFFKSKAYYDAARGLDLLEEDLEILVKEDRLRGIKGFGEALSKKITELVSTGKLDYYNQLKDTIPAGLIEMLKIPGLGPKKVKALYETLRITTISELKFACAENKLLKLPGFGAKTQLKILEGIENLGRYAGQYLYAHASQIADKLVFSLKESGLVIRCSEGGSLRRKKEIVKDIDILASSDRNSEVMDTFTSNPLVAKVTAKGETKSSVILTDGINADLRVVSDEEFPYALHHFTGSKEHNTALRHHAKQENIKMNEYGLFRGDELIRCRSEEEIFGFFGMQFIPPELREDNGELEAALKKEIPVLVEEKDLKGVLHVHTNYSDGSDSIMQLAEFCRALGYSYLGIADHSQSAYYAGGLKPDDIKRQHAEIDTLNESFTGFRILKGIEADILPDGSIDYSDEILSWFDFVIGSVHTSFKMDEDKMTERVIKAIKNSFLTILGHPTGRLLLSREPYKININEVIKAAAQEGVIVEINSNPYRLDLDWRFCKAARDEGCKFAICPDAHNISGISDVKYGINIARKGWLRKNDIINSLSIDELTAVFHIRQHSGMVY